MPVDNQNQLIFAYKALKILTQDFEDLEAYKKGYIDKNGKRIISHWSELEQSKYLKDYNIFIRFMIIIKQFLEKLPGQEKRLFKYQLLLKALREEVSIISDEKDATEFILELSQEIFHHKNSFDELNEAMQNVLFGNKSILSEEKTYNILNDYESKISESMVAGSLSGGGNSETKPEGIAGINDAQDDPAKNTIVNKSKKKKKKKLFSKKINKVLEKL